MKDLTNNGLVVMIEYGVYVHFFLKGYSSFCVNSRLFTMSFYS